MAEIDTTAIDEHLWQLWDQKGTDLLFTAGVPPLLRVNGTMGPAEGAPVLTAADTERIVSSLLPPEVAEEFAREKDADFSFGWGDRARFRANVFQQQGAMGLSLRLIPFKIPSFEELGLPAIVERFVSVPRGLVLATGPTGAGKSTTLASMIDRINQQRRCHIITIEDPIEYVHVHKMAAVNQREVGLDTTSFPRGIRAALRADPDVLLVGEIRDEETAGIAMQAGMTGHLVLTTVHAHNAASAIERLKDMGVEPGLLANAVNCIVAQRLARRLCTDCREAYWPSDEELESMGMFERKGEIYLHHSKGCGRCGGTGYRGRVALYEVMPVTVEIRRLVGAPTDEIFNAAVREGMTTLRQDGLRLCLEGVSSLEEIRRVTGDRLG